MKSRHDGNAEVSHDGDTQDGRDGKRPWRTSGGEAGQIDKRRPDRRLERRRGEDPSPSIRRRDDAKRKSKGSWCTSWDESVRQMQKSAGGEGYSCLTCQRWFKTEMTIRAHLRNNDGDPDHPPKSDLVQWGVRDVSPERQRALVDRAVKSSTGGGRERRHSSKPTSAADARNSRFNQHLQRGSGAVGQDTWRGAWADVRLRMSERFKADHTGDIGFACLSCKLQYKLLSDMERHLFMQKGISNHPSEGHLRCWGLQGRQALKHEGGNLEQIDRPVVEAFIKVWMANRPSKELETTQQAITDMETQLGKSRLQLSSLFGSADMLLRYLRAAALQANVRSQLCHGKGGANKMVRLWGGAGASKRDPREAARAKALGAPLVSGDLGQRASPKAFVRPSAKKKAHAVPTVPSDFAAIAAGLASEPRLDDCDIDGFFLPKELEGVRVLVEEATNTWRIDNTLLNATTDGLGYRNTKTMGDHVGEGIFAKWGFLLTGCDEGDGWVAVRSDVFVYPDADQVEKVWNVQNPAAQENIVPSATPKMTKSPAVEPKPTGADVLGQGNAAANADDDTLPYPWQVIEGNDDTYFFNEVTGRTQWERPDIR